MSVMSVKTTTAKLSAALLLGAATSVLSHAAMAQEPDDIIVVTSQRQEQSLQDVPISVTALGSADLQDRQIEGFTDIQFNTPNLSFTKSQFTSSVISIRGVSQLAVASTSTDSISIHQNDIPQSSSRLFETEFYDVERVEILRGPQGTLFGRNATGGVLNVITAKASPDEVTAAAELQYGTFDHIKATGHINMPVSDTLAVRVAGAIIQRDGFTENVATGNRIDDRDVYSVRGSVRWYPTDNTTIDVAASYFKEDDNRTSFQKVRCNSHPVLGCATGLVGTPGFETLGFDQPNINGTISTIASAQSLGAIGNRLGRQIGASFGQQVAQQQLGLNLITAADVPNIIASTSASFGAALANTFAGYGLFSPVDLMGNPIDYAALQGLTQPTDLRQVALDTDPRYVSDELFISFNLAHDFENFSVKLNGGYGDTSVNSIRDTDGGVGPAFAVPDFSMLPHPSTVLAGLSTSGGGVPVMFPSPVLPSNSGLPAFYANGLPTSQVGSEGGVITGEVFSRSNNISGVEQSIGATKYYTFEGIVASNFDSPFNFLLGANYLRDKSTDGADFNVSLNTLDYFGVVGGTLVAHTLAAAGELPADFINPAGVFSFYSPTFNNNSVDSTLRSVSVFGEAYWDVTDTLKVTVGARYNNDKISTFDRNSFLASFNAFLAGAPIAPALPIGTTPGALQAILDSAPTMEGTTGAVSDFALTDLTFDAVTGRAVVQWEFSPGQNFYVSYSRGFKPGGVNPPSTGSLVFNETFEDESINAYEVGAKLILLDGVLRANLAGFYYDYSNLQVTNIIGLTSVIDNVDAKMYGVEGEFVIQPTDFMRFNVTASWLDTEFGEAFIIDPANPAGFQDVDVYRDVIQGIACVVDNNGLPSLVGQTVPGFGVVTPFVPLCSTLGTIVDGVNATLPMGAPQYEFSASGLPVNLDGNELPQAPEYTLAVGGEVDFRIGDNLIFTPRFDYYRQGSFYSGQFNRAADFVDEYGHLNLQATLAPEEGNWYFRLFAQNVTNNDAVTGQFTGAQAQGTFINQFILEPRRWGGAFGFRF